MKVQKNEAESELSTRTQRTFSTTIQRKFLTRMHTYTNQPQTRRAHILKSQNALSFFGMSPILCVSEQIKLDWSAGQ